MKSTKRTTLKGLSAFVCLWLITICALTAQEKNYEWRDSTAAGYTYKYVTNDPMNARFYTLDNGLKVILSVNKKEPRIQTYIAVRAGSNNDPKDHTGLAHYLEHLLFKGTDQYGSLDWQKEKPYIDNIEQLYEQYNHTEDDVARKGIYHEIDSVSGIAAKYAIANEYDKLMAAMGAQNTNAHTAVEETVYQEDIPSSSLDKYLAVQAERFRHPVFRLFHTELEAVYEEKNRGLDNDGRKVYETMMAALFPHSNYGLQSTIGTVEHLKNPSIKAIQEFYDTWYVPNNMAIIMAGDLDPDVVVKKIDQAFAYMKPETIKEYKAPAEPTMDQPVMKEVLGPDAENVNIAFRLPGVTDSRSQLMMYVVSALLTNGKAGLMDLDLNKQQKVLGAGAYVHGMKDYAMLVLYGRAKQDQRLEEVKDLLLGEVEKLKAGDFDESLVKAIVNNARLGEMQALENNGSRASSLMNAFIQDKGELWPNDVSFLDKMAEVTKADVIAFAKTYLNNNYVLVYKRKGEDKNVVKVEKPQITPVSINREAQSAFLKKVATMPNSAVKPQWLDYDKGIKRGKIGKADLLYVKNKDNTLFNLYYRFDMGGWNDKLLPYAASYLQYLGTVSKSAEEISKAFYNMACNFNIRVGSEETTISISGLQENFEQAVTLFEELMAGCQPDETALAALKGRIDKSRADSKLNKGAIMQGLAQYAMYGAKNPFNHQLNAQELQEITTDELISKLHQLMKHAHKIIYFGPKTLDEISQQVKKLHPMPEAWQAVDKGIQFSKIDQMTPQVFFTDYDMVQTEVYWVHNNGKYDANQTATLSVFNNYFGGGMGSVVFQTIRESKALAYSTYASYSSPSKLNDRYTMVAYVGAQADKMNDAIGSMNALLTEMPETNQLLQNAKKQIKQDIETQRITKEGIIFSYLAAQKLGLKEDLRKKVYESVDDISLQDLKNFHQHEIQGRPYTYCVMASEKRINVQDLSKFGIVKQLSLEEIFGY